MQSHNNCSNKKHLIVGTYSVFIILPLSNKLYFMQKKEQLFKTRHVSVLRTFVWTTGPNFEIQDVWLPYILLMCLSN